MYGFMRLSYLTISRYTVARAVVNTEPLNKTHSQVILTFIIKDIYYTYTEHQGTQQKKEVATSTPAAQKRVHVL